MSLPKDRKPPTLPHQNINLLELLVVTILSLAGLFYLITSMSSGDWAWFLSNSSFNAQPLRIELYHEGTTTTFLPGDPTYEAMTEAVNEQLRDLQGYWEVGLRDDVLEDARQKYTSLIFVYATPIRLHTQWNIGTPNTLLVPVTGSYSNEERIYIGTNGNFLRGAVTVTDLSRLRQMATDAPQP